MPLFPSSHIIAPFIQIQLHFNSRLKGIYLVNFYLFTLNEQKYMSITKLFSVVLTETLVKTHLCTKICVQSGAVIFLCAPNDM